MKDIIAGAEELKTTPDGSGPGHPLSRVEENGTVGLLIEEDEVAQLDRLDTARKHLILTLRAVLAERMVNAPTEELDATDALRAARKRVFGTSRFAPSNN